jgi:hypothetical protein
MIGECLSEDKLRVVRLLLGRVLNIDLDGSVLYISFHVCTQPIIAYIDIWKLGNFASH